MLELGIVILIVFLLLSYFLNVEIRNNKKMKEKLVNFDEIKRELVILQKIDHIDVMVEINKWTQKLVSGEDKDWYRWSLLVDGRYWCGSAKNFPTISHAWTDATKVSSRIPTMKMSREVR